jgi:SAM-dependent methyltransferase
VSARGRFPIELRCGGGHRFGEHDGLLSLVPSDNYADSFSLEWRRHSRTQVDKFNGTHISKDRFFEYTSWPRDLRGQRILEAGCGSGRFTQVMLDAGAEVVSFDFSEAVLANRDNNGEHPRLTLFRGDIFQIPFAPRSFDRVLCLGVLQHTPDPARAFQALAAMVRPGGWLAADVYRLAPISLLHPKYILRPFRHFVTHERLFSICRRLVPVLLPMKAAIRRVPIVGVPLAHLLVPVPDYRGRLPLTDEQAAAWSELDLFDWIAPAHDHPATRGRVARWCASAGLEDVQLRVVSKGWQIAISGRAPRIGVD